MRRRLSIFAKVILTTSVLAGCGGTASHSSEEATTGGADAVGDGGTGGSPQASGGAVGGTGGSFGLLKPVVCDPAKDWECQGERVVRNDVKGTLPSDAVSPSFTEGPCGSGSDLELVAVGLRALDRFGLASMPTKNAPGAVYFVHSPAVGVVAVGRIDKGDCTYDPAFRENSDLAAAAVTASHLLWRPALGVVAPHFLWDALDGSSSVALPFAGGHPVGANETEIFLHEVTSSGGVLSRFDGETRKNVAYVDAEEFHVFGNSALGITSGGLEKTGYGIWVDMERGDFFRVGLLPPPGGEGPGFWESAVVYGDFLYYCDEGVVRVDGAGRDHVRIIDAPCQKLVHADETGLYFTTPNGLARAKLDGSSPELVAPGGELFDDMHIYFFEGADLWRIVRPAAPS